MLQTLYRAAAGAFTAVCVVAQYWLLVRGDSLAGMAGSSLRFFSFFTILTNVLAAATLLIPLVAPHSAAGRFLTRPPVRTAVTGYIIMVGVIYYLLLRDLSQRQGWPMFFEYMLHYVTPPLFVIDWLAFVDKRALDWRVGIERAGLSACLSRVDGDPRRRDGLVSLPVHRCGGTGIPARLPQHCRAGARVRGTAGGAGGNRAPARAQG